MIYHAAIHHDNLNDHSQELEIENFTSMVCITQSEALLLQ